MKKKIISLIFMLALALNAVVCFASQSQVRPVDIHFIDTGNSDSILISDNGKYMLIDGADNDDEQLLVNYLNNLKVKKLDYVVLTHPDADHAGGLDSVIKRFEIGNVFIGNGRSDTKTYKDFVQAAIDKNLKPSVPLDSDFTLGNGKFKFYNQKSQSKDINDSSLVMLYTNGNNKFLFTGDADVDVEKALPLKEIGDIDVLKVGHHGSKTSSSKAFIDSIKAEYNVICVGKDNKYNHPNKEVTTRLTGTTYRTDLNGNIVVTSDGKNIAVKTTKKDAAPTINNNSSVTPSTKPIVENKVSTNNSAKIYITKTGKKYHIGTCRTLKSKIESTVQEAQAKGLTACGVCNP